MLEPATSVKNGIHINDFDILEIYFSHNKNIPEIIISDGDNELKRFSGKNAYIDAMLYLKEGFDY